MNRPSLVVLDVGHGNAAVLLDTGGVVVIDAGKGGVLIDFLKQEGIKTVDVLLISHADADHVRNAPDLLLDEGIEVKRVCFNSDPSKESRIWRHFQVAIRKARREKGLLAEPQLTTSQTGQLDRGGVHVEVLYPPPEMAASAPGGITDEEETLTSNSMSAVVRLSTSKGRMVMLAGDVEPGCLRLWNDEKVDPKASILVYPHHGGNPGENDPVAFAIALAQAIKPKAVIFSIHRSQYELPKPDVVSAVRTQAQGVRVICTQLSGHCSAAVPASVAGHLTAYEANGRAGNTCCAGTMVIDLSGDEPQLQPQETQHLTFIKTLAGKPLCI